MKKLFAIVGAVLLSAAVYAATTQPQALGLVTLVVETKTVAQMNLYAAKSTGQLLFVSDATVSRICVSSGTTTGAWVIAVATGTFAGTSYPHCQ